MRALKSRINHCEHIWQSESPNRALLYRSPGRNLTEPHDQCPCKHKRQRILRFDIYCRPTLGGLAFRCGMVTPYSHPTNVAPGSPRAEGPAFRKNLGFWPYKSYQNSLRMTLLASAAPTKCGAATGCPGPAKAKSLSHKTNILAPSPPLHPPPPTLKLGFCDRDPSVRRRSLGTKW